MSHPLQTGILAVLSQAPETPIPPSEILKRRRHEAGAAIAARFAVPLTNAPSGARRGNPVDKANMPTG
jgi:hypothetical protein